MRAVAPLIPVTDMVDTMHNLDHWATWQRAQSLSERTIKDRRDVLTHLAAHASTTLLDITPEHIINYLSRPTLSPASKASYHASIRAFYKWACQTGRLTTNPCDKTPTPKRPKGVPRPVEPAHLSALLKVANRRRTKAMIILAAYGGMRVHEIAKFHGHDIDRVSDAITITGKGGKTALIPAHPVIMDTARNFPPDNYWFPAYNGAPHIHSTQVSRAIKNAMHRAGFTGKAHQLRHYYASELLDNGVDIRVVKELMRHESIATTELYTRVSMKRMREGIAALPQVA